MGRRKPRPFRTRKAAVRATRKMPTTRGYTKWKPYKIGNAWWIESHKKRR